MIGERRRLQSRYSGGERGISRKPSRRECRIVRRPVVTCLRAFFTCTQGCGCVWRPAFPAPSDFPRDANDAQLGRIRAAGMLTLVIARSAATTQSIYPLCRDMDCFACARNDGIGRRAARKWAADPRRKPPHLEISPKVHKLCRAIGVILL